MTSITIGVAKMPVKVFLFWGFLCGPLRNLCVLCVKTADNAEEKLCVICVRILWFE